MKQKLLNLLSLLKPKALAFAQMLGSNLLAIMKSSPIPFFVGLAIGKVFHAELSLALKLAEDVVKLLLKLL